MPATLDGFVVAGSGVVTGLTAGNHLNRFGMMTAALTGHHVGLAVSNFVADNVCATHVAD